jgi:hypothetical protein
MLAAVYAEHMADHGELLPQVLFGDLTRLVTKLCKFDPSSKDLTSILEILEKGMAAGDNKTKELISVSFLENLDPEADYFSALRGMLGPTLSNELQSYL